MPCLKLGVCVRAMCVPADEALQDECTCEVLRRALVLFSELNLFLLKIKKNCAALAEVQPAQPPTTSSTFPGADGGACPSEVSASSRNMLREPSAWSRLIQS